MQLLRWTKMIFSDSDSEGRAAGKQLNLRPRLPPTPTHTNSPKRGCTFRRCWPHIHRPLNISLNLTRVHQVDVVIGYQLLRSVPRIGRFVSSFAEQSPLASGRTGASFRIHGAYLIESALEAARLAKKF